MTWLGIRIVSDFLADFASRKWKCGTAKRKIVTIALCSLTYEVWRARNDSIWNFNVPMVNRVTCQVKIVVKSRVLNIPIKGVNIQHPWIRNLFYFE